METVPDLRRGERPDQGAIDRERRALFRRRGRFDDTDGHTSVVLTVPEGLDYRLPATETTSTSIVTRLSPAVR